MNDRYLFKAKRKNWKELPKVEQCIIGHYCPKSNYVNMNGIQTLITEHTIVYELSKNRYSQEEIDLSTLCQCTCLKDKHGTLIWENDIVEISKEDGYFSVDWDEDTARFVMNGDGLTVDFDNYWSHEVEVVGNRADNPELLEVE